ncbi:hypothetical protein [Bradyrhizobium arachidis]|uniref:Uncharacterized protein n=1 Tax=Bradyrhizobium arachidis TaxID=858423 RepID=A0AAE7NK76_9BRAD|nr:hypothetical protein [Bradyrhizobium arachidis]QOZ65881.1 hypothetical protein WN72_05190 [Bradyrhizobium arachidis]SFV18975.1 hypothetical protein SAMN05192541_14348 [Bradyrhizobium arachidis]
MNSREQYQAFAALEYRQRQDAANKTTLRLAAIFGAASLLALASVPYWPKLADAPLASTPSQTPTGAAAAPKVFPFILTTR